jgi:hypothetical protein
MPKARTPIICPTFSSKESVFRVFSAQPEVSGDAALGSAGGCGGGVIERKHELDSTARKSRTADAIHGPERAKSIDLPC